MLIFTHGKFMTIKAYLFVLLITSLISSSVFSDTAVRIPLEDIRLASDDLVADDGSFLTAEQAESLKKSGQKDISLLNPRETDFWKNKTYAFGALDSSLDDLPIQEGQVLDYQSKIGSMSGVFRFNVLPVAGGLNKVFTITMSKRLHTTLLRKNLLRKLGYVIPAMKYLKKIRVNFKTLSAKKEFLEKSLPRDAQGHPERWIVDEKSREDDNILSLEIQDVIVTSPDETDHFNVAVATPPRRFTSRVWRSLAIPYSLLDVRESINKLSHVEGRIDRGAVILQHFARADLNTTKDDALWMLRRMSFLTRSDFEEIVKNAHYPKELEPVLIEKLVSRFRSEYKNFEVESYLGAPRTDLEPQAVADSEHVKDGIIQKDLWEGHAARYAHGEADSPFDDGKYFVLSKIQGSAIDELIGELNKNIRLFDVGAERARFFIDRFNKGLNEFVETGFLNDFGVGTHFSPIADPRLIVSRNIVIGNQFGTDNLVQFADTFGYGISLGGHLGIESPLGQDWSGFARGEVSYLKTYSHLKPVRDLKQTFEEPYKNLIVPLVKKQIEEGLSGFEEFTDSEFDFEKWGQTLKEAERKLRRKPVIGEDGEKVIDEETGQEVLDYDKDDLRDFFRRAGSDYDKGAALAEKSKTMLEHINENLNVGESLIITDRLVGSASLGGNNLFRVFSGSPMASVSVNAGLSGQIIKRTQVFRLDEETVQIYVDKGISGTTSFSLSLRYYIPIFRFDTRTTDGKYRIKLYTVNLDDDLSRNPRLADNAHALEHFLKNGSTELMDHVREPDVVSSDFLDKSNRFAFLFFRNRNIYREDYVTIQTSGREEENFVRFLNEKQSGINLQNFVIDIANYLIEEYVDDLGLGIGFLENLEIKDNPWRNPGQTRKGKSETQEVRLEGRLIGDEEDLKDREIDGNFMAITHREERRAIDQRGLLKTVRNINEKFGSAIFNEDQIRDIVGLRLFDMSVHLNLYEEALNRLQSIPKESLLQIQEKYLNENSRRRACWGLGGRRISVRCGNLSWHIRLNKKCQRLIRENKGNNKIGRCLVRLAGHLSKAIKFADFVQLLGGIENVFVHGQINGFRRDSEILNDPILSNTLGEVSGEHIDGPLNFIRTKLRMQGGEFYGTWMRENLR